MKQNLPVIELTQAMHAYILAKDAVNTSAHAVIDAAVQTIDRVRQATDLGEIETALQDLEKYQEVLARLIFQFGFDYGNDVRTFVTTCDRLDDSQVRAQLVASIKNGTFYLKH